LRIVQPAVEQDSVAGFLFFIKGVHDMDRVSVFDTTLRDGEQSAGLRLGSGEKLEIARQLARLGVDVIEAGYPNSSPEDFEAVRLIGAKVKGVIVCALSRVVPADIEACAKALKDAEHPRIHTGIGVSDIHIEGKFRNEKYGRNLTEKKEKILKMSVEAVRRARQYVGDVEFYAEDSGRAERSYLFELLHAVVDAGATVINVPDTTGYALPSQFGPLIRDICAEIGHRAIISIHCHDDLGMAVANTLAGIENGARQVEGTINGIGERAGNAALEEVVMALCTRRDALKVGTGIDTRQFYRTSRMVADAFGMSIPPNKAVVGGNAFAHSSGIHVDGFLKERATYEIMSPEDVGFPKSRVVLTARTGRHGLKHRLEELGFELPPDKMEPVYARFLNVADRKQEVFDDDLVAIIHDEVSEIPERYRLDYLHTSGGTGAIPTATVRLMVGNEVRQGAACGDGPVDATYKAIAEVAGMHPELLHYEIRSATAGAEAIGEVTVRLREKEVQVIGHGASTDIIEASARAYIDGMNRLAAVGEAIP
jgi:2-isopropylmalate synthase